MNPVDYVRHVDHIFEVMEDLGSDKLHWMKDHRIRQKDISSASPATRYNIFSKVQFWVQDKQVPALIFVRLLQYWDEFVIDDSQVGCIPKHTYYFHIEDPRLIQQKVCFYLLDAKHWLTEYLKSEVDKGVFKKIDISCEYKPMFISAIILVSRVQYSQKC